MTFVDPSIDVELLFPTPDTPDLGCLVRREHDLEKDFDFHMWSELSGVVHRHHQVYFRVKCGSAAFHQRCAVYMSNDFVVPGTPITATLGGAMLGGEFPPRPSDWQKFPVQQIPRQYWFHGEHRNPNAGSWSRDAMVGHSFDTYEHGTLSTVGWDDTGSDADLNDLIVEVAVLDRGGYFWWMKTAEVAEAEVEEFRRKTFVARTSDHEHPAGSRARSTTRP